MAIALAQRQVTAEEKFFYLVASYCIWLAASYIGSLIIFAPDGWLFWYEGLIVIIITAAGLIRCRDKYQGVQDDRLLEDTLILSVPLGLKFIAFTWLAYLSFNEFFNWFVLNITFDEDPSGTLIMYVVNGTLKFYPFLITVIGTFIYFLRLSTHIKTVADGAS
ncbi:MAG: hypothetical protein R8M11_02470 [Gallionella sp.]